MARTEESVAPNIESDSEERVQMEFWVWVSKHPAADCSLNISKDLAIDLYGIRWHLQLLRRSRSEEGGWQRGSFAVGRVETSTLIWAWEEDKVITGALQRLQRGLRRVKSRGDWECYLLERFEKPDTETRRRAVACKQAVEEAQSFGDVLDALNDASVWLAEAESAKDLRMSATAQRLVFCEMGKGFCEQSNNTMYLKMEAREASARCETAKEVQQEASKAAARELGECYSSEMPVRAGNEHSGCVWGERFQRSEAVENGLVLQWCTVDINKHGESFHVECRIEVGELLVEENEMEAARIVGIAVDEPLLISIGLDFQSFLITQDQISNPNHFLFLREIVKKELPWLSFPNSPCSLESNGHSTYNVLLNMLQQVARYLSGLCWKCAVCGHARGEQGIQKLVSPCRKDICQATFSAWEHACRLEGGQL